MLKRHTLLVFRELVKYSNNYFK